MNTTTGAQRHNKRQDAILAKVDSIQRKRYVPDIDLTLWDERRLRAACFRIMSEGVVVADVYRDDIARVMRGSLDLFRACKGLLAELQNGQNVPSLAIMEMIREAVEKVEDEKCH